MTALLSNFLALAITFTDSFYPHPILCDRKKVVKTIPTALDNKANFQKNEHILLLELLQRYLCSCMSFHSIGWMRVKDSVGSFGVPIRTRFTSEWSSMPLTLASCWRKLQGKLLTRTLFQKPYRKFCRYVTYRNKLLLYHVINHHIVCVSETVTISPSKRNGS